MRMREIACGRGSASPMRGPGRRHRGWTIAGVGTAIWLGGLPLHASADAAAVAPGTSAPQLGKPLSADDVRRIDTSVFPDGRGLPPGQGSVAAGEPIYRSKCAACHGARGEGATAEDLAGGTEPLSSATPDKTIGSYWPYATTLFDFTRRSMPMDAPESLSADDTYAVTAYLLFLNGIVDKRATLDARSLAAVRMPNRDGFDAIDAPRKRHR